MKNGNHTAHNLIFVSERIIWLPSSTQRFCRVTWKYKYGNSRIFWREFRRGTKSSNLGLMPGLRPVWSYLKPF